MKATNNADRTSGLRVLCCGPQMATQHRWRLFLRIQAILQVYLSAVMAAGYSLQARMVTSTSGTSMGLPCGHELRLLEVARVAGSQSWAATPALMKFNGMQLHSLSTMQCIDLVYHSRADAVDVHTFKRLIPPQTAGACRYFLLSQVRAAGDNVSVPREVLDSVPLDSIPELMCSLGYYPSQSAVTDMISSLAHMASMRKEPKPISVSLEKLLFLYYNFSPVNGVRH